MPIGVYTDFKLYDEQFQSGQYEVLARVIDIFNGASRNAVRMVTQDLLGHYNKQAFFKKLSGLIQHRNIGSTSAVSDLPLTQGELVGVKVNKRIGPVAQTIDSFRKIGATDEEISYILGQMVGEAQLLNMVDSAVLAVEAALEGQTALNFDATGETTKTVTQAHLVSGLSKFGDQAARIIAWVMYSKNYFDLVKESLSEKIVNVADVTIYRGTIATLGRPSLVIDSPALHDANGSATDTYNILGLVEDSVVVTESEPGMFTKDTVLGAENILVRFQGEYAYNVNVKGFKWDTSGGGINPNDTALGNPNYWVKELTQDRDLAGVRIKVQ
jgi:hypothetical protein